MTDDVRSWEQVGGDVWHRGLLLRIVETGLKYNAYNTPVETLHSLTEVDCFIGGLVAGYSAPIIPRAELQNK